MSAPTSIVIPIYNAGEEAVACIDSVLASDAGDRPVLLMDDGSSQETIDLIRRRYASANNVRRYASLHNRGYSHNVQYGIDESRTDNICVLNSDAVVPPVWLAKLEKHLTSHPSIAGVGPLSNAASYQSIPVVHDHAGGFSTNSGFGADDPGRANLNALLELLFDGTVADVPILNGFCTLFCKSALVQVGGLDTANFGDGYGEENDLCVRLVASGYRLSVALDTFVYHHKSRSFGQERGSRLSRQGAAKLSSIYGPQLLPDLADMLENHRILRGVRRVFAAFGLEPTTRVRRLDASQQGAADLLSEPALLVASGPCLVQIDSRSIAVSPIENPPAHLTYALAGGGARIWIPQGAQLAFNSLDPVASAIAYLSLVSNVSPVFAYPTIQSDQALVDPRITEYEDFRFLYMADSLPALERV